MPTIEIQIRDTKIKALIDTGSQKSCLNSNLPILKQFPQSPANSKLLCANNEIIHCTSKYDVQFRIGEKLFEHTFVSVPGLSGNAILGMDFINDLQISDKNQSIIINNVKAGNLPKVQVYGLSNETTRTSPYQLNLTVEVVNPFFEDKSVNCILIEPFQNQTHKKFIVNSSVSNNTPTISVSLSNLQSRSSLIPKNMKICHLEPITDDINKINGIKQVITDPYELEQFHEERLAKFGEIKEFNFGSIGPNLSGTEKEKLMDLFTEKNLALARCPKDVGKIAKYRYTLPMYDEKDTAYCPPRPIPPNILPKVENEMAKFKELDIIETSESGFNIPLLILKKSDGTLRVSLDARQLNTKLKDRKSVV